MKALVLEQKEAVSIQERPMPQRKPGEALVRIKAASVCGSDISAYRGKGVQVEYPLVLGHEVVGEIVEIDSDNPGGFGPGDRVILHPYIYCGQCYPCSLGQTNCCENLKVLGVQTGGAMQEYFCHPHQLLHKLPDSIPWELAPLAEPLVIAIHGLHRAKVKAGEHVVIIGAGPIGIMAAMVAKKYGATPILLDIVDARLDIAKELGIPYTINTQTENAEEAIRELTAGRMAEAILEMSGAHQSVQNCLVYSSYCSRIALTGWPTGETPLLTPLITRKELEIYGARTGADEFPEALELIASGDVDAKAIASLVVPFDELPQALVEQAEHPEKYLKVVALF
ncbi:alcohol dehydrogenase catalytic domain-containing protein [Oscillospiraceae bacterium MB08-C2-2]|nr:alcohol dehydrogenase catalytic domain-containing protein [Oscillospiraceae bacterium MB08-C2-2]